MTSRIINPYRFRLETVAFGFWFVTTAKAFLVFLFFQNSPAKGTLAAGLLSIGFLLLLGMHFLNKGFPQTKLIWPATGKWMLAYLFWGALTLVWTRADSRLTAFAYYVIMLSDVLVVFLLMRLGDRERIGISSLQGLVIGASVLAIVALFLGGTTSDNRLGNAEFLHPNVIGKQMALSGLCGIYLVMQSRRGLLAVYFWLSVSAVLLTTLLLSLSKTSIAAFSAAVLVFTAWNSARVQKKILVLIGFGVIVSLVLGHLTEYLDQYLHVTQGGQALSTISGRTIVWTETLEMIRQNPFWGYGFLSFRDFGPQPFPARLVTAHNEWLQQWFSLGGLGLLLTALVYAGFFRLARQICKVKFGLRKGLALGLLVFALVRGMVEADPAGLVFPLPLLMLMMIWLSNGQDHEGPLWDGKS